MPTVKKLQFANGTNITPPADLTLETAVKSLPTFVDDAAYAAFPGNVVGEGSIYLNTTLNALRMYLDGAWRTGINQENAADATKKVVLDTDDATTGVTHTLDFSGTIDRTYTFPDVEATVVLTLSAQDLEDKTLINGFLDGTKIKNGALDVDAAGSLAIGSSVGLNNLTLGGVNSTVQIPGSLVVSGLVTTVNTDNLDVKDKNIKVNSGGNDATAEGSGITVDRDATDGSLVYDSSLQSKWKLGDLGSEKEIIDASSNQSLSTKTLVEPIIDNFMDLNEEAAPASPSSGSLRVYAKTDGKIYKKDSSGLETEIGAGGGGGVSSGSAGKNYLNEWYDATKTVEISSTTIDFNSNRIVDGVDDKKWVLNNEPNITIVNNTVNPSRNPQDLKIVGSADGVLAFVDSPLFEIDPVDYRDEIFINFDYQLSQSVYKIKIVRYGSDGTFKEIIDLEPYVTESISVFDNSVKTSFYPYKLGVSSADDLYSLRIERTNTLSSDLYFSNLFIGPNNLITDPKKVYKNISQSTPHGFAVGDVVYFNGSTYAKAISTAANTSEVVGVVSKVVNVFVFEVTSLGEIDGLTGLVAGEVYFLSADTAGALTVTEPSVIGQVSVPIGVASSTTELYVAPKRGVVVGGVNARAEVALTSGAVTNVQNVGAYDAGELTGWVFISSAAPVRFYLSARFAKSGAGGDFNLSYSTTGDTPPAGFLVDITTTGMIRVTLPASSGTTSAINYALNAPAIGASFPLTVSASQIVGDTNPVGTMLDYAGTTAPTGYLMCDGQSLSTTGTYAALFAVLGYAYGGSGASFNIPDFRGRFARYLDNMGGTAANRDSGRLIGTSQSDLVKEHNVTVEAGARVGNKQFSKLEINDTAFATTAQSGTELLRFAGNIVNDTRNNDTNFTRTVRAGDIDAAETRPINLACTKIIKF